MGTASRVILLALSAGLAGCQPRGGAGLKSQTVAPHAPAAAPAERIVQPFDGIKVRLRADDAAVEVQAFTCLDAGFLEQVACSPGTREHESLLVVPAKPSLVHAALLMAGFEPGAPGEWRLDSGNLIEVNPRGEQLDVLVRYRDPSGAMREHSVRDWIRSASPDEHAAAVRPLQPWVFGGSRRADKTGRDGATELYVADVSGSVVGLVTFGDEVVGYSRVMPDQADVQPLEWEADADALPPLDTAVTLIFKRFKGPPAR